MGRLPASAAAYVAVYIAGVELGRVTLRSTVRSAAAWRSLALRLAAVDVLLWLGALAAAECALPHTVAVVGLAVVAACVGALHATPAIGVAMRSEPMHGVRRW